MPFTRLATWDFLRFLHQIPTMFTISREEGSDYIFTLVAPAKTITSVPTDLVMIFITPLILFLSIASATGTFLSARRSIHISTTRGKGSIAT